MNHEKYMAMMPEYYSDGSEKEMIILVQNNARSWLETEGVMAWVQGKIQWRKKDSGFEPQYGRHGALASDQTFC